MSLKNIAAFLISLVLLIFFLSGSVFAATEMDRKAEVEKWDKKGLRFSTGTVTDTSKDFLKIPDNYKGKRDFEVAKAVPVIEFAPFREENPYFFPEDNKGLWSQWGEVTLGPNGCFYMATGDHRCKDGHVFIIEYDPKKKDYRIAVDVAQLCGWKKGQYVDGKIHGKMDIMPDGTLVAATWLGHDVTPDEVAHGYVRGGHLMTYNVFSGVGTYQGVPLYGDSWPYHSIDPRTWTMLAIGNEQMFMSYDVRNKKLLYGGRPPRDIIWNSRSMLLDPDTGLVYSANTSKDHNFTPTKEDYNIISFDQKTNLFAKLKCKVPVNPVTSLTTALRAYTERRTPEGYFWCFDYQGTMFKFYPDEERTELVGVNWDTSGVYTTSISISPKNRYLYYVLMGHGSSQKWGSPVIQYDTKTDKKKVIAFLEPYYQTTYGYIAGGTYGIELSEDGSLLVIHMNGQFGPWSERSAYGQTSIFAVHIPESERVE